MSNSDSIGAPASAARSRSIDQSLPGCRGRSNVFDVYRTLGTILQSFGLFHSNLSFRGRSIAKVLE